jgi:hypothetical protein
MRIGSVFSRLAALVVCAGFCGTALAGNTESTRPLNGASDFDVEQFGTFEGSAPGTQPYAGPSVALGGTATTNLVTALNALGVPFTNFGASDPAPGSADIIIIGRDGGQGLGHDYRAWLDGGGCLILTGGSSLQVYYDTVRLYFNIDGQPGWHTDGPWTNAGNHPANQGLPSPYNFVEVGHTYHMLHFTATPNTVFYGTNGEGNNVAAFRTYANGGTFNYMALDLGIRANDQAEFITPWVKAALAACAGGGKKCEYTITKSKGKGGCGTCPRPGNTIRTEQGCENVVDCRKKIKTTIECPEGPGVCKIKAKRTACS